MTIGDSPDIGYCIHAEFSLEQEFLAFPVRETYNEEDYKGIYAEPHIRTMRTLEENNDCLKMYTKYLPGRL